MKQNEKRLIDENRMAADIKKKYDMMKRKLEKTNKDKQENVNQLKSLFALFTQQRKALEVSIRKTKQLEEEKRGVDSFKKGQDDQIKQLQQRIQQLETEKEIMQNQHRRGKENLESELDEKRHAFKKYEMDFKDLNNQKVHMKKQMDDYESKIRQLIKEIEQESKKHIAEMNQVHEEYRGYKNKSKELEERIKRYKYDYDKAIEAERDTRKELIKSNFSIDELEEKLSFVELKYQSLIQKLGASQEDLIAIEEEVMESDHIKKDRKKKKKQTSYKQADRSESRLEKRRDEDYFQESDEESPNERYSKQRKVVSGEQVIESSIHNKSKGKVQHVEVLENPDIESQREHLQEDSQSQESDGLLDKLIENLETVPQLKNVNIQNMFHLQNIKTKTDLQEYKNLLRAFAALFYTNNSMNSLRIFFEGWKDKTIEKLNQKQSKSQDKSSNKKKGGIQIDTELANQEYQPQIFQDIDDEPSGIQPDRADNMIHIQDDDNNFDDEDEEDQDMEDIEKDEEVRDFFNNMKEVKNTAKQMLNYSYPPILYQRENEEDEEDEEGLPDFAGAMEDDDEDIEELIRGGGKDELYQHLQDEIDNDDGPYYREMKDKDGKVYLVEANDDDDDFRDSDLEFHDM